MSPEAIRPPAAHRPGALPSAVARPDACSIQAPGAIEHQFFFERTHGANVAEPFLLRARPDLRFWDQLIALADAAEPHDVDFGPVAGCRRVDRRAALRTERLQPLVPVLRRLDVDLGRAGAQREAVGAREDDSTERRAGEHLTISAMADHHVLRVGLGFVGDAAAKAAAVDFHASPP